MSKTTEYIINLMNQPEIVDTKASNCCLAPLKDDSYSINFGMETGLCSDCHDGCEATTITEK